MDKRTVRKEVEERRARLNQRELNKFNKEINSHISVSRLFLEGKVIMGYLAMAGKEVSVDQAMQTQPLIWERQSVSPRSWTLMAICRLFAL